MRQGAYHLDSYFTRIFPRIIFSIHPSASPCPSLYNPLISFDIHVHLTKTWDNSWIDMALQELQLYQTDFYHVCLEFLNMDRLLNSPPSRLVPQSKAPMAIKLPHSIAWHGNELLQSFVIQLSTNQLGYRRLVPRRIETRISLSFPLSIWIRGLWSRRSSQMKNMFTIHRVFVTMVYMSLSNTSPLTVKILLAYLMVSFSTGSDWTW